MKLILSYVLYFFGDLVSRTFMVWGNGFGYNLYRKLMLWSCDLDKAGRIWKYVNEKTPNKCTFTNKKKPNKHKNRK